MLPVDTRFLLATKEVPLPVKKLEETPISCTSFQMVVVPIWEMRSICSFETETLLGEQMFPTMAVSFMVDEYNCSNNIR